MVGCGSAPHRTAEGLALGAIAEIGRDASGPQCPIIQGRPPEAAARGASAVRAVRFGPQQPHPAAWLRRGALALRSLVACATRRPASIVARAGTVSSARGAGTPQPGQGCGAVNSAMGRVSVNAPQASQR